MKQNFFAADWESYLPKPVYAEHPEYEQLYNKAWEIAHTRVRDIPGMPQNPYMDESLCDTQVWIWDSCFMAFFCKYAQEVFPGVETLNNFYEVLHNGGSLPRIVPKETEPAWTRATPGVPSNIYIHIADNPPLFAWAEHENALLRGDLARVKELLYHQQYLQKHYEWIEGLKESQTLPGVFNPTRLIHEENGYKWECGRSGMDNTPRGRTTPKTDKERPNNPDLLWVDALCQQALSADMIAKLFRLVKDEENAALWDKKFQEKQELINRLYWDNQDQFYYDIDCNTSDFIKVPTVASFWPLTAGAASKEQAAAMVRHVDNPDTFGGLVPFPTLSRSDANFESSGRYWRGAMWMPTAYASLKGIARYGYLKEARHAAIKIFEHMLKTYLTYEPHTIWECYAPDAATPAVTPKGDKIVRPNFCGWSALGPISMYIEYILGFHTVNAFENTVEWEKPEEVTGEIGLKNLHFGDIVTDIVANGDEVTVQSNAPYTLKVNGRAFDIKTGENKIIL